MQGQHGTFEFMSKASQQDWRFIFYVTAIWFNTNSTLSNYHYPCHHQYLYLDVLPLHNASVI